ncbi:carboxypeptidase regulatory-like domain-containing protein [bacterium]|nr:carboxypeptidase regulatory-like domain-containing protein [bacterium]
MRWLFLTSLLLLTIASSLYAVDMRDLQSNLPMQIETKDIQENHLRVTLQFSTPEWTNVQNENQELFLADFPMAGSLEAMGNPLVPSVGRLFRIPPRSGVTVDIIDVEYDLLTDIDYASWFGNENGEDLFSLSQLLEDSWYPESIAEASPPAILHDFRVSRLLTYPVQVNPSRREVRVYNRIEVDIHFEGVDDRNALETNPVQISEAYLPWYRQLLDWDENELDEYALYRGNVQVVIRNNENLLDMMEDWFVWKRQKGWEIELLTDDDVDWTHTAIRNELIDRYEEAETKFDYVVIVGDDTGPYSVPASTGAGYGHGDHRYATLAGNDELIDVAVGRISVENNTHVQTYVNKVLTYERDPDLNNVGWYLHGQVAVSSTFSGISTVFVGRYHRRAMFDIGYTRADTAWVEPWGNGNVNARTIERFNDGISYYSSRGYINAGLNTGQIAALNNENMTPVAIDLTCSTGNWSQEYGISEAYIRAGNANMAKGAIGAVGNATGGTNPRFNNALSGGAAYSVLVLRNPTLGDMYFGAKYNIWTNFHELDNGLNNFNQWHNLMGDPTVWLWTAVPEVLQVEAQGTITLGSNGYEVLVQNEGSPVEKAWVTLYKVDEDDEVIAHGVTDRNGYIMLNAPIRFAGDAMLTVTKQNFAPFRLEVNVINPEQNVGYTSVEVQDDGDDGTIGNGNGIAEACETIGLRVAVKNFGEETENDLVLSVSSEDAWITAIEGELEFGDVPSWDDAESDDVILVSLAPSAQHQWKAHLLFTFSSETGEYQDNFAVELNAPRFAFVENNNLHLDPGEQDDFTIDFRNVGGSDATAADVLLVSDDPYLSIITPEASLAAANVGQTRTTTTFTIEAHEATLPGHLAHAYSIITTETGQIDTAYFNIPIGNRTSTDPMGPDSYGYYAFDNVDVGYDQRPEYDWIEISPDANNPEFDGVELNLQDNADNRDDAVVVDLPFPVRYYGVEFDEATISSNGMMAMGSQADVPNSRNFTIPSPLGPNYMIAPYWDERILSYGSAVLTYFDEPNGQFIVEWYRVRDYNNQHPCTFQVIFYDEAIRPTPTGDNEILFQYNLMEHTRGVQWGTSADVYYWTTGIENGTQTDGLQIAYWNQLSPGASTIGNARAILFTTNVITITGSVAGTVIASETGDPIAGAEVFSSDRLFSTTTNDEGAYLLDEVVIGNFHYFSAFANGYNLQELGPIEVSENQTTELDFGLTHPVFGADRLELDFTLSVGEQFTNEIVLSNTGNGDLEFSIVIDPTAPNELDDAWEDYFEMELIPDESRNRAVTFFDDCFWIAGSNNNDIGANKLYRYNRDGVFLGVYDQPVENHSSAGFYDLANDGESMYGADRGDIYQYTFRNNSVVLEDSWNCPVNNVRTLTYDTDRDLFWISGRIEENLMAIDRQGTVHYQYNIADLDAQGLAYYPNDQDGYTLYIICESGDTFRIVKMNPLTGDTRLVNHFDIAEDTDGAEITNMFNPMLWTFLTIYDGGNLDHVQVWEMELNSNWIDINPSSGTILPGENLQVSISVTAEDFEPGLYHAWVNINHNAHEQFYNIPLTVEVTGDLLEPHFQSVDPTGDPYAIILDEVIFEDNEVEAGDEIGIFDGDLCVGAVVITGEYPLPMTAWESEPARDLPGYTPGNEMNFRLWDRSTQREFNTDVEYLEGDGNFDFGPFSQVTLTVIYENILVVPLNGNYFELVSVNLVPQNLDASAIFGDIANLLIAYQNNGDIFLPPDINTIGEIDVSQGYQLFSSSDATWTVTGEPLDPATIYSLNPNTWNWMGYPFVERLNIESALHEIRDHVLIVMTDEGNFWLPDIVNDIGEMVPGVGYFIFVDEEVQFQYNTTALQAPTLGVTPTCRFPHVEGSTPPTGLPYLVLIEMDEKVLSLNPSTIELFDGNKMVGKSVVANDFDFTPVIAWGGSEEHGLEGFTRGSEILIVLRDEMDQKLTVQVDQTNNRFGEGAYASVNVTTVDIPTVFTVQKGYPNPFNPSIVIPFGLPEAGNVEFAAYNILGQRVFQETQQFDAGYHKFIFDSKNADFDLVSGVYFLQIEFHDTASTQKIMLLR